MKKIIFLSFVFSVLTFLSAGSIASAAAAAVYHIHVVSSFATTFEDCIRFDNPGPGNLTVDGLPSGTVLTWRHTNLDTSPNTFFSVTQSASACPNSFQISFDGNFSSANTKVSGQAISELGDTFVYKSVNDSFCSSTKPLHNGENKYVRP